MPTRLRTALGTTLLSIGLMGLALSQPAQATAKFYKWVDSSGSTHYTQTPPPGSKLARSKTVMVSTHIPVDARKVAEKATATTSTTQTTTTTNTNGTTTTTVAVPAAASLTPGANGQPVEPGASTVTQQATGNNTALPAKPPAPDR